MSKTKIRVFVVAGGKSRRMGGVDKTRMSIGGEPMISRAIAMGLSISSRVEVVADRWDRFIDLGIYSHEDVGDRGPADAWSRVFEELKEGETAVILPVDLKVFSPAWISRLLRVVEETGRPAAFISPTHEIEPYPCAIPWSSVKELSETMSLRKVLETIAVVRTTRPEDFPESPSINEPAEALELEQGSSVV